MKTKYFPLIIAILLLMALLSACRTLEVRIETAAPSEAAVIDSTATPTPPAAQTETTAQPTSTPEPSLVSTPISSPTAEATGTSTLVPATSSSFAGLVYRQGDQLFWINTDGQPAPLAPGLDPQYLPDLFTPRAAISSDGRYMVSWWDFSDLWLVDLSTGELKNLTQTSDRVEYSAQFWPGRPDTIIFMSQSVEDQGPSMGYLSTIQLDGTGYRLLDDTASSIGLPALSPDGLTIAYDRGGEAWLYRWEGGPESINLSDYQVSETLKVANPAWSPVGKYLAWMATTSPASPDTHAGLALFNMESKIYRMLHTFQSLGHGGWYITPVWSPDGTWLALYDESQDQPGVWILHPDGSGETQVFAASSVRSVAGLQVLWSPDSSIILILDPNAEGGLRAEGIDILSGEKVVLLLPEGSLPLAWIHR
jgi:Tol biopolymer transport system component